jgi:hypothetical protein
VLIQAEPRPVANGELQLLVLLIVRRLHDALCLKKPVTHLDGERVPVT